MKQITRKASDIKKHRTSAEGKMHKTSSQLLAQIDKTMSSKSNKSNGSSSSSFNKLMSRLSFKST